MKMENVEDVYPLSPMQQGMVFHTLAAPRSGVYVVQYCCVLHGDLDVPIFKKAWTRAWERHSALRTAFLWDGLEEPLQIVRRKAELPWTVHNLQHLCTPEQDHELEKFLHADRKDGFDLAQAPLARVHLFRLSPNSHHMIWSFHHLLADGWSTLLVVKDVLTIYEAALGGTDLELKQIRPYSDYIAWVQSQDLAKAESFWKEMLKGFTASTPIGLNGAFARLGEPDVPQERQQRSLTESLTKKLNAAAREQRVTLNTLVQGAWAYLLARYSGTQDVVFGSTVSGRPTDLKGVEEMVGLFINTLAVRVRLTGDEIVGSWLQKLQTQLVESRKFEYTPLAKVQSWSEISGNQPLFETILVFENSPVNEEAFNQNSSLRMQDIQYRDQSNYPLVVLAMPGPQLQFAILYHPSRFEDRGIREMLGHLEMLLVGMATNPDKALLDLPLLTEPERRRILVEWNRTECVTPQQTHWLEYFAEQAAAHPEKDAVLCGDDHLSYFELNYRTNQLAHYLRSLGVGPSSRVGIHLKRSPELIVALLGILKAGGAYVPLDPDYPGERLAYMMRDSEITILLTQKELRSQVPEHTAKIVRIDSDWEEIDRHSKEKPTLEACPEDLCYMIYTSGSTGQPRGVMVTHQNLHHSIWARFQVYKDYPVRCFLLLSSISFDSSVAGIFWTLGQGGTLCIPGPNQWLEPSVIADQITRHEVSHLLCIPSLYRHLLGTHSGSIKQLQTVIVAGESCPSNLVEQHFKCSHAALFNEYGPTEGTVWSTVFDCSELNGKASVPIGRPIPNVRIYVLDEAFQPVPAGLPGEVYIGGEGVARGYLNHPELTAQKFIRNPIPEEQGSMLYRTGDMARFLHDGNLEFLGRSDDQVKIRGYRVEPGEIQEALVLHPDIREAAVIVGNRQMSQTMETGTVEDLRQRLAELDSVKAEQLLSEMEQLSDKEVNALLGEEDLRAPEHRIMKRPDFDVSLNLKNPEFIHPPRQMQKDWLLNQAMKEFCDNLTDLDALSARFVAGMTSELKPYDISSADLDAEAIMEDWQTPIMKAMARLVTETHGDVLEVGFGRGVSSSFIQECGVRSHTIVESNEQIVRRFHAPWKKAHAGRSTRLLQGRWQDLTDQLEMYDGIFFHAFPLNEQEFLEYILKSTTFAEHFFPTASSHLNTGGVFSYLTTEIDSLSRRHQRLLFKYFNSISLSVQPLTIPPDTKDAWWAESMIIIKAIK